MTSKTVLSQLAPHPLNTAAPLYPTLQSIFTNPASNIAWWHHSSSVLGAHYTSPEGALVSSLFAHNDINQVCPAILESILSNAAPSVHTSDSSALTIRDLAYLWNHCEHPGAFVARSMREEQYLRTCHDIISVDEASETVLTNSTIYTVFMREPGSHAKVKNTTIAGVSRDQSCICTLQLSLLEQHYPGFTQRANLGFELDLDGPMIAQYAVNAHANLPRLSEEGLAAINNLSI